MMRKVNDSLGRTVAYNHPPRRIISLDPAITETLYYFGLDQEIVGRTRFCVHPKEKVKQAANIGGTKDMKLERVHQLNPDLIIAEKEENTKEMVETLADYYPVYVFEIKTVKDAFQMLVDLGQLTGYSKKALILKTKVETKFNQLPKIKNSHIAYMIWKKPYMAVGRDTYINDMLKKLGFVNQFASFGDRYPVITQEDLQGVDLDYLFLSSEPYPFNDKHHQEFLSFLPDVNILNIDGEMFWYGSRMLKAATYFSNLFIQLSDSETGS